ncbi:MAG TPA: cob(I)yrinic acid a,c-diamide adenosyltransferase, partial [Candidatus Binatia bacterium]
ELFDLGSELATPPETAPNRTSRLGQEHVRRIEEIIDHCQKELEPLQSFILPGGGRIGAYLHQCRTVCRRAEREILRLSRIEETGPLTLQYINRLSDLFFVLARWVGKHLGEREYLWERGLEPKPGRGE